MGGRGSVAEVVAGSSEAPINEYSSFATSRGKQTYAKLAIDSLEKPESVLELSLDGLILCLIAQPLADLRLDFTRVGHDSCC